MKRELVPFNEMWHVDGSLEVYRLKSYDRIVVLCNINDTEKPIKVSYNNTRPLKNVSIGGIKVGDAFDKLYDLEMLDEVPTPEELDKMKELGESLGFSNFTPLDMSKVLTMYYNVMTLVDDFDDVVDPYELLTNEK
jgi:hypothetical protein